jgi:amylosucrase
MWDMNYQPTTLSIEHLETALSQVLPDPAAQIAFKQRIAPNFERLRVLLAQLYGYLPDFEGHLEQIILATAQMYAQRSTELRQLDQEREATPMWFQSQQMMGAVCYVDRFSKTIKGLYDHLDYLEELHITYLHLMPLYKAPVERNDGGYAVTSFRDVNPSIGTMTELAQLAKTLRERGISLVLDFVFNHTSEEHLWAQKALAGDPQYQAYYRMFDGRILPDQYERNLREIFPEQAPGNFTYRPEIGKWVWTTFFNFQWDLNYANPEVFRAMLEEMLFLANQGVEVLRLDAVPFIWKELGTNCENLPQAHVIIQAFNILVGAAAPAMLFKSEAIVHPRDVQSYVRGDECQLSYNPLMMVCMWDALATRDTRLLTHSMQKHFALPSNTAWINYIRSHDDIGWGFADEDAAEIGVDASDHRFFLNLYYTGRFPGSYSVGIPFNYNPKTQDMRISGTTASLIGLEKALQSGDRAVVDLAVQRILLVQSIALSAGGIPLIYLGDEIGTLNDYSYRNDPKLKDDSRWVHRPKMNWQKAKKRNKPHTVESRIFTKLAELIQLRSRTPELANGETQFLNSGNFHILAFLRHHKLLVITNFSEREQIVHPTQFVPQFHGIKLKNLIDNQLYAPEQLRLKPYEYVWLLPQL